MKTMKTVLNNIRNILIFSILIWFVFSNTVFAFRHPWATSTERLLYIKESFLFEKVPYKKMRPIED